jgi:hypothetical protein
VLFGAETIRSHHGAVTLAIAIAPLAMPWAHGAAQHWTVSPPTIDYRPGGRSGCDSEEPPHARYTFELVFTPILKLEA